MADKLRLNKVIDLLEQGKVVFSSVPVNTWTLCPRLARAIASSVPIQALPPKLAWHITPIRIQVLH